MLYLKMFDGEPEVPDYEYYTSDYFNSVYETEWFADPFVQQFLKEIDNLTVTRELALVHPYYGAIPYEKISTGSKTLMLLLKTDRKVEGARLGPNCYPFLLKIAEEKDVYLRVSFVPQFPEETVAVCLDTGKTLRGSWEILKAYIDLTYEIHEKMREEADSI